MCHGVPGGGGEGMVFSLGNAPEVDALASFTPVSDSVGPGRAVHEVRRKLRVSTLTVLNIGLVGSPRRLWGRVVTVRWRARAITVRKPSDL